MEGIHNKNLPQTIERLRKSGVYKDLSSIMIMPTLGTISTVVVKSWMELMTPPNQKILRLWPENLEVGVAYSQAVEMILANPELSKWKYIITLEHDNLPPPDGVLKLLEVMEERPEFSAIGGLYFTKGYNGVPQIWGDIKDPVLNFRPQLPVPGGVVECCGVAMGFTAWRIGMFKDPRLRRPFFKTLAEYTPGQGGAMFTQDLYFWNDARKYGHRCAIDCRIKVGHYDHNNPAEKFF